MLPLLLGLLGVFFQIYSGKKGVQGFWVTFFLFFMTGLAIVIYLNQKPMEPRERDYAYAGSFYAFAIWIGLGVAAIVKILTQYLKLKELPATITASALCILVPIQMVSQTWDDHDRSKRFVARDFGYNYLTTCEPDAIIFTMGDNDTFPLWYGQEVEGYRTDVRVCNLSYLQTDWYIDQMKREAYESTPLPISWKKSDYIMGKNEFVYIFNQRKDPWEVALALDWIKSDDLRTKRLFGGKVELDHIPTDLLYIPVDSAKVVQSGLVKPDFHDKIHKELSIYLGETKDSEGNVIEEGKVGIQKQEMIIMDIINNNKDWTRPIYFAITVSPDQYQVYEKYLRQDGLAYRLVPYELNESNIIDTDVLYDNLMNKYRWGNLEEPGLYIDENTGKMARTSRTMFARLSEKLIDEGKNEKAKEVLDRCLLVIPEYNVPYDFYSTFAIANSYFNLGEIEKSREILDVLVGNSIHFLRWFSRLNNKMYLDNSNEALREIRCLMSYFQIYRFVNPEQYEVFIKEYNIYYERYRQMTTPRQTNLRGGANR